jgi:hypothetical protein
VAGETEGAPPLHQSVTPSLISDLASGCDSVASRLRQCLTRFVHETRILSQWYRVFAVRVSFCLTIAARPKTPRLTKDVLEAS